MPDDDGDALLRLKVGVSSCLLGAEVRYDGGHKRDAFVVEELGRFVELVPICPEVELGMGIPRESVSLVHDPRRRLRMVGNSSGEDWTERMVRFSERRVATLEQLVGYVLKSNSPSCGLERVKVVDTAGAVVSMDGRGLFAAALCARFPHLPMEEEARLEDRLARESFIDRLFAYARLRASR